MCKPFHAFLVECNRTNLGLRDVCSRKVCSFGFKEELSYSVSLNSMVALLVPYSYISHFLVVVTFSNWG